MKIIELKKIKLSKSALKTIEPFCHCSLNFGGLVIDGNFRHSINSKNKKQGIKSLKQYLKKVIDKMDITIQEFIK